MPSLSADQPPSRFTNINGVNRLNPYYSEWKKQHGKTSLPVQSKQPIIDKMSVQITIIKGLDLVAKDRNLFGKKTSSDPYVLVYLFSSGQMNEREQKIKLGQTPTVKKNLSPTWNHSVSTTLPYHKKSDNNRIIFQIFDEDKLSADDSMGIINIPLAFQDSTEPAVWHEIPKNSAKNASGKIQILIQTSLHYAKGLVPYC